MSQKAGHMGQHRFSKRLLQQLPSPQREVLTLRLVGGLSSEGVAAELGINVTLVRRIQQQGLLQIRRSLKSA